MTGERVDMKMFAPVCLPKRTDTFQNKNGFVYGEPLKQKITSINNPINFKDGESPMMVLLLTHLWKFRLFGVKILYSSSPC